MTGRRARRRLGRIAGFTAGLCLLAGLVTLAGTQAAAQFDRSSGPAQSSTVTLTVRLITHRPAGMACPDFIKLAPVKATLTAPLGDRTVVDGTSGRHVTVTRR